MNNKKPTRKQLKMELHKLLIAQADIDVASHCCRRISLIPPGLFYLQRPRHIRDSYSLCVAAIVCYARPFTPSEPAGSIPSKYAKYSTMRYRAVHKSIIDARNEFIAHSDLSYRSVTVYPPGIILGGKAYDHVQFSSVYTGFRQELYREMLDLTKELSSRLQVGVEELRDILYKDAIFTDGRPFQLKLDDNF